jgi:hypothetical protein
MFGLTLVDHLRLTFGHVIYAHRAHSELALRHARWNRWLQAAEAILIFAAATAAIALAATGQVPYGVVAAAAASTAAIVLVLRLAFDFERTAHAHRASGARLWHIREQYRAVLSDLKDDMLTVEAARERRDTLMAALHAIYEDAPPADRAVYEAARNALPGADDTDLSDEEVDRFLPGSLQKRRTADES